LLREVGAARGAAHAQELLERNRSRDGGLPVADECERAGLKRRQQPSLDRGSHGQGIDD
jgi:hypothetical protein